MAYAVVNRKSPKINFYNLFPDKDVKVARAEILIKVCVQAVEK